MHQEPTLPLDYAKKPVSDAPSQRHRSGSTEKRATHPECVSNTADVGSGLY